MEINESSYHDINKFKTFDLPPLSKRVSQKESPKIKPLPSIKYKKHKMSSELIPAMGGGGPPGFLSRI